MTDAILMEQQVKAIDPKWPSLISSEFDPILFQDQNW